MHVLQVSPYVVHPPNDGGAHRAHGLVKAFPRLGGYVDRYCQGLSSAQYRQLDLRRWVRIADRYVERRHLNPVHDAAKLPMLAGLPNVFSNRALERTPGPLRALAADADAVLVREPWVVGAVDELVDLPLVYSSHNVESERFDDLRHGRHHERWLFRQVLSLERTALDAADLVVCTSARDARTYQTRFGYAGPVHVAPNATYRRSIRPHTPDSEGARRIRRRYDISSDATVALFVGSDHPPNVEAVEAILTMARRTDHEVHFLVVGSVCDAVAPRADGVTLTGFVDDLEAHFDASDVALNPMLSGGGTNIKVLDYFARGLPVVSTPFGVRGLDVTDGEEAVIVELDAFPEAIAALTADPVHRDRIGKNARELVREQYTWEVVSEHLYETLSKQFA